MRVLVTRPLPAQCLARLRRVVDVTLRDEPSPPSEDDLVTMIPGHEAVICQLTEPITSRVLDAAPTLRLVSQVAVGLDNVDLGACRARGIAVAHTPGVLTDATADLTMALMLAAARRLPEAERYVRGGRWTVWSLDLLTGLELRGAVLGIVGLGRIGQAVARRARAFGMRIVYSGRRRAARAIEEQLDATWCALDDLLAQSDVVSLHAPLTDATRGLFDAGRLRRFKPGAILVNTARGGLIDEPALAAALDAGPLAFAALDVFADEPRVHPSLLDREDVLLVPHIGSATRATRARMAALATDAVIDFAEGRPLAHTALTSGG